MLRCEVCDGAIDEERIKAILSATGQLPQTCSTHSPKGEVIGFMVEGCPEEGGSIKGARKSMSLLTIDSTKFADPKEAKRKALRAHRRAR